MELSWLDYVARIIGGMVVGTALLAGREAGHAIARWIFGDV